MDWPKDIRSPSSSRILTMLYKFHLVYRDLQNLNSVFLVMTIALSQIPPLCQPTPLASQLHSAANVLASKVRVFVSVLWISWKWNFSLKHLVVVNLICTVVPNDRRTQWGNFLWLISTLYHAPLAMKPLLTSKLCVHYLYYKVQRY